MSTSQHLWQIGADEIAAPVQLVRIALWAIAVELFAPLHQIAAAPVLLDQLGDAVAALAVAMESGIEPTAETRRKSIGDNARNGTAFSAMAPS